MQNTKMMIVDLADRLIRTRGYNAFSYRDIASELQIKNAAIHYHFPAKADLGQAVVEQNRQHFLTQTTAWENWEAPRQLKAFIGIYETNSAQNWICFMGALGPAYVTLPAPMQKNLAMAQEEIRDWLSAVLRRGRRKKQFTFKETINEKTDLIITALLSALILQRISGADPLANVRRAIFKGL